MDACYRPVTCWTVKEEKKATNKEEIQMKDISNSPKCLADKELSEKSNDGIKNEEDLNVHDSFEEDLKVHDTFDEYWKANVTFEEDLKVHDTFEEDLNVHDTFKDTANNEITESQEPHGESNDDLIPEMPRNKRSQEAQFQTKEKRLADSILQILSENENTEELRIEMDGDNIQNQGNEIEVIARPRYIPPRNESLWEKVWRYLQILTFILVTAATFYGIAANYYCKLSKVATDHLIFTIALLIINNVWVAIMNICNERTSRLCKIIYSTFACLLGFYVCVIYFQLLPGEVRELGCM